MLQGLKIYEKVPEDIQLFTHTYYPLITNRIIQRNLVKYNIPNEIQYLILTYLNINYTFDQDMVYFYFEPVVFLVDNKLQVSVYSWYGCHTPENYNPGIILHCISDRPYSIRLERNFGRIAYNMYQHIKRFNLREDVIKGLFDFVGTNGPLVAGLENSVGLHYDKISNAGWHYSTVDVFNYFKELNVIDNSINNLNEEIINSSIKSITELIEKSIEKSMFNFNSSNNSTITGPFYNNCEDRKKIFYKIEKKKSDQQFIIEKNMLNQLTR